MDSLLLHIDKRKIKAGYYKKGKDTVLAANETQNDLYTQSSINTAEVKSEFSVILKQLNLEKSKAPTLIILEPEVAITSVLQGNKNGGETLSQEAAARALGIENASDYYLSWQKIAPFVYQVTGIRKATMEQILEVASSVNVSLFGAVSWAHLLPKTNPDVASLTLYTKENKLYTVSGILSGTSKVSSEVNTVKTKVDLINDYKHDDSYQAVNTDPIVYTVGGELKPEAYQEGSNTIAVPFTKDGFESLDIVHWCLENVPGILDTSSNLLNLLPVPEVAKKKPVAVIAVAGILAVSVLAGGSYLAYQKGIIGKNGKDNVLSAEKESPQSTLSAKQQERAEQEQKAEEIKELKRSDLKISVLNGNGTPGSAAKMQVYMEGFGYKVENLDNAESSENEKTKIEVKKDKENYKDLLVNDLKTNYETTFSANLPQDSEYDVIVTVGKK